MAQNPFISCPPNPDQYIILAIFFLCSTYPILQVLQIPYPAENIILWHTFIFAIAVPFAWTNFPQKTPRYLLWPTQMSHPSSWSHCSLWPYSKAYTTVGKHILTESLPFRPSKNFISNHAAPQSNLAELFWFTYAPLLCHGTFSFLSQKHSPLSIFPMLSISQTPPGFSDLCSEITTSHKPF